MGVSNTVFITSFFMVAFHSSIQFNSIQFNKQKQYCFLNIITLFTFFVFFILFHIYVYIKLLNHRIGHSTGLVIVGVFMIALSSGEDKV